MKLKIIYRKNLGMSPGKLAAQAVHAALMLKPTAKCNPVIVLGYSDKKFNELVDLYKASVVHDAGRTEVEPGTATCAAYYESP